MDNDRPMTELKKLREGRGLTAARLAKCPNLLCAAGTSDPGEAVEVLTAILDRMGETDPVRALKIDLGLDLAGLLGRAPTAREVELLGQRRAGYAEVLGRDVKTLARWSDRALAELRAQLITDQFDGHVVIAAGVKNRRVVGIELIRYEQDDAQLSSGKNVGYTNPESGSSLPLVLFGYPRDWRPIDIRFVIAFMDEDYPRSVWALVADGVLDVGFGHERYGLDIDDGLARCRIENPRRDHLYGVWWEW